MAILHLQDRKHTCHSFHWYFTMFLLTYVGRTQHSSQRCCAHQWDQRCVTHMFQGHKHHSMSSLAQSPLQPRSQRLSNLYKETSTELSNQKWHQLLAPTHWCGGSARVGSCLVVAHDTME